MDMTKVLKFPDLHLRALRVRASQRHEVSIRITDRSRPEEARWFTQFAVQRASGFSALKGFTDLAAFAGRRHNFEVGRTFRIRRFLRDVEPLIVDRRLVVEVDGQRVRVGIGGSRTSDKIA
jgi:limonene-1,2-epoxide hydrolase